MAELEIFASFVLFAGGDGGSVSHIERSVVGVGDAVSPSGRPGMEGYREMREKMWRLDTLSIVSLPPAEETMVEGAKEEGGEKKRDGVQRELCYAREGGPVGWRLIASDRKLVPAQDVGPIVASHDQERDEGGM